MKLFTLCAGLLAGLFSLPAQAQGVTIGAPGAPDASATLEVRSTAGGLLLPRLTSVQRVVIAAPAAGLLVFQTDNTPGVYYYDGTSWRNLTTGGAPATAGVVTTLAGSTQGFANGLATTQGQFIGPRGVACDGSGNVYVADTNNNCIRRIVAGRVFTLAGSTTPGFADGSATTAQFNGPRGVACDARGHVYVADTFNQRIRVIEVATGAVTTLAGSSLGDNNGPGATAQFNFPSGVACDASGTIVYVADTKNHSIRFIDVATAGVHWLAGTGPAGFIDGPFATARFNTPLGVAFDGNDRLYVADYNNYRIRCIVLSSGDVSTLAGSATQGLADGTGTAARFVSPGGVACDGTGYNYVYVTDGNRIRRIVAATGVVTTLAGFSASGSADGTGTNAQFAGPAGVACDADGNLFVADTNNHRIRVIK